MLHCLVTLRRLDDPLNECRDVILYGPPGRTWCVWQAIWFASGDSMARAQEAQGTEFEMRKFFAARVTQLRDEGFTVCEPAAHAELQSRRLRPTPDKPIDW